MSDAEGSHEMDPLIFAVLEAESHMARKGWGLAPQLYALATKASLIAVDQELPAEVLDAPEGALIPVEQGPLPEGDPIEVLASIQWPYEVVGCILVSELIVLPPDAEGHAPSDPAAAEQWASNRPDGRQARLAVGVSRSGEYICGLRMKGEDEVQVGAELADDIVTALLGTFLRNVILSGTAPPDQRPDLPLRSQRLRGRGTHRSQRPVGGSTGLWRPDRGSVPRRSVSLRVTGPDLASMLDGARVVGRVRDVHPVSTIPRTLTATRSTRVSPDPS